MELETPNARPKVSALSLYFLEKKNEMKLKKKIDLKRNDLDLDINRKS